MKRTRLTLYYLCTYLMVGGLGLSLAPRLALRLLASNGEYGDIFPRVTGMLMVGLGAIVAAIIWLRAEAFYPVTVGIRLFFLVCIPLLHIASGDPFFLVLEGIVGLGVLLTGTSWLRERSARTGGATGPVAATSAIRG
jgi:hypothetical protein